MKHFNITFKPDGRQISIHSGATLVEAAGQAQIILNTVCGGEGTCEKCKVILEPIGREVLACQYHINSDLTVFIPPTSRFFEQKILAKGIDAHAKVVPDIFKKYLKDAADGKILGLAVDIGTTTVVAKLIDMTNAKTLATESDLNPQIRYGDDVVSRIAYADSEAKFHILQQMIVECLNTLIKRLCKVSECNTKNIYEVCAVGNTTMNHILLQWPIHQLGQAPYEAHSLEAADISAAHLGLDVNPNANVHTVENIAGFVGSDTIAVGLAVEIASATQPTLVVDIGTNGELLLNTGHKLYSASCAAGPALEGGRITCGSRAVEGAIEAVVLNANDIDIDVIGNCPPRSICGSGLIDAVAVILDLGIIDKTGRFLQSDQLKRKLSQPLADRLIVDDGRLAFCLADTPQAKVILTAADIRQVQLAKAAIGAGIKLLQKKAALADDDIERILLAGAFGNYIRRKNAVRIGLLPDIRHDRIRFVGNAASSGAQMILLSSNCRKLAGKLAADIEYVEIAKETDFSDIYADSMIF